MDCEIGDLVSPEHTEVLEVSDTVGSRGGRRPFWPTPSTQPGPGLEEPIIVEVPASSAGSARPEVQTNETGNPCNGGNRRKANWSKEVTCDFGSGNILRRLSQRRLTELRADLSALRLKESTTAFLPLVSVESSARPAKWFIFPDGSFTRGKPNVASWGLCVVDLLEDGSYNFVGYMGARLED